MTRRDLDTGFSALKHGIRLAFELARCRLGAASGGSKGAEIHDSTFTTFSTHSLLTISCYTESKMLKTVSLVQILTSVAHVDAQLAEMALWLAERRPHPDVRGEKKTTLQPCSTAGWPTKFRIVRRMRKTQQKKAIPKRSEGQEMS